MTDYGPVYCDVREPQAREQHKAVSCPDKILTAFCQLGALRMKARRALVFMFDINHAYIMAEATQTLSLEHDDTHDPGDQLWSKSRICSPLLEHSRYCAADPCPSGVADSYEATFMIIPIRDCADA